MRTDTCASDDIVRMKPRNPRSRYPHQFGGRTGISTTYALPVSLARSPVNALAAQSTAPIPGNPRPPTHLTPPLDTFRTFFEVSVIISFSNGWSQAPPTWVAVADFWCREPQLEQSWSQADHNGSSPASIDPIFKTWPSLALRAPRALHKETQRLSRSWQITKAIDTWLKGQSRVQCRCMVLGRSGATYLRVSMFP